MLMWPGRHDLFNARLRFAVFAAGGEHAGSSYQLHTSFPPSPGSELSWRRQ